MIYSVELKKNGQSLGYYTEKEMAEEHLKFIQKYYGDVAEVKEKEKAGD